MHLDFTVCVCEHATSPFTRYVCDAKRARVNEAAPLLARCARRTYE